MESLSDILSSAAAPDKSETPVEALAEPAKDEKPAEPVKADPAASAPSAEQAKPEEKPAAAEKPAETPEDAQARDDKGRFAKPEELESLRKAMQAERKKRQEAERKAREAEERANSTKPPEPEKPKKDFWDDPNAAVDERVSAETRKIREESDRRYFSLCETITRRDHTDYEEIVDELLEEADADPALKAQVWGATRAEAEAGRNPAEYLYKTAKNRREMKAVGGDLEKFKDSIAQPFKATVAEKEKALAERDTQIAELGKQIKSLQSQLDKLGKVPTSLNSEPSAARAAVDAESAGPEPLDAILEPRKKRRA